MQRVRNQFRGSTSMSCICRCIILYIALRAIVMFEPYCCTVTIMTKPRRNDSTIEPNFSPRLLFHVPRKSLLSHHIIDDDLPCIYLSLIVRPPSFNSTTTQIPDEVRTTDCDYFFLSDSLMSIIYSEVQLHVFVFHSPTLLEQSSMPPSR